MNELLATKTEEIKIMFTITAIVVIFSLFIQGCGNIGGANKSNEKSLEQASLIADALVKTLQDESVIESKAFKPSEYDGWRDMTAWDSDSDAFKITLAQNLGIDSFNELTKKYPIKAKGFDGKVYVWIYRNTVFVLLSGTTRGDGMMMMPAAEEGYVPDPWDRTMAYDELYVQKSFDSRIIDEADEAAKSN